MRAFDFDGINTMRPMFFAILALVLAGLACQAVGDDVPMISGTPVPVVSAPEYDDDAVPAADSPPSVAIPRPVVESSVTLPDPIQPRGPGMACFGLRADGLTCLDENGWQTFTRDNSGLPSNFIQAGGVCPDERIVIAHANGLSLFDGENWENIPATRSYTIANSVACASDGSLWVAHFRGVSTYANGQWTTYAAEFLSSGETASELVYHIVALPEGRVWALTARSVAVFENGKWEIFQEDQGFSDSVFFNALTIDSLGRPWASLSRGVTVYDHGWQFVGTPGYGSSSSMAFDASGKLWLGSASNGVSVYNGNTWVDFNRRLGTLPSDRIRDVVADSQGRVWVATTYGLVVFDGDQRQVYRMDNSEIGDNELRFVVVVNDGPAIPGVGARQWRGNGRKTG
jgi:hypothetical protein